MRWATILAIFYKLIRSPWLGCRIKARSDDDVSNASNFIIHIFDGTNNISTMIAEKSGKKHFFTLKDKSPYMHVCTRVVRLFLVQWYHGRTSPDKTSRDKTSRLKYVPKRCATKRRPTQNVARQNVAFQNVAQR
jgi:hypothetical protein